MPTPTSFLDYIDPRFKHIADHITQGDAVECALGTFLEEVRNETAHWFSLYLPEYEELPGKEFGELKGKVLNAALTAYFEVTKMEIPKG